MKEMKRQDLKYWRESEAERRDRQERRSYD